MNSADILQSYKELADEVQCYPFSHTDDQTIEYLKEAQAVVCGLPNLSSKVLKECSDLKVISNYGVGLDNIDLKYARSKSIKIGWEMGVNKSSVAEIVLGRSIDLLRGINWSQREMLAGNWINPKGREIKQIKLGILGFGQIGKEVARIFRFLGAEVTAYDIFPDQKNAIKLGVKLTQDLDYILKESDIISCHLPLTRKTKNLLSIKELEKMKTNSVLINTSRGGIVDEIALAQVLRAGHLHGAALDVFSKEPVETHHKLLDCPNFLGTAHISGTSDSAVGAMAIATVNGLINPFSVEEIYTMNPWMIED